MRSFPNPVCATLYGTQATLFQGPSYQLPPSSTYQQHSVALLSQRKLVGVFDAGAWLRAKDEVDAL